MCVGKAGVRQSFVLLVKPSNAHVHFRKEFSTEGLQRDHCYCQLSLQTVGVVESN